MGPSAARRYGHDENRAMRSVVLQVRRYLGLVAACFLLILSTTDGVMAYEQEIERWVIA